MDQKCSRCGATTPHSPDTAPPTHCPACGAPLAASAPFAGRAGEPGGSWDAAAAAVWWLLGEDGREYGPVSKTELDQWYREGRVSARCRIRQGSAAPWVPASTVYPSLAGLGVSPTGVPASVAPEGEGEQRQFIVALLLAILPLFAGLSGLHRLYTGHIAIGILLLLTCGMCGIWQMVDIILLAAGAYRDAQGRPLV